MKFLIDNQLPPALARFIRDELKAEALHVLDLHLKDATDLTIWKYACAGNFTIDSKDGDFATLYMTGLQGIERAPALGSSRKLPPGSSARILSSILAPHPPRPRYTELMRNEFTAIVETDDPWFVSHCAELPGANGQGRTREDCLQDRREAITLILDPRREDSTRALPADAEQQFVVVG